ncbi:hypothetical protein C2G38_1248241 [Gigaspora rosea]|uniref:Uncharacterized protein n=1 Tax=Gigaspora rosea TaxID=44941 RepID=A0A397VCG2_9GLOM|nr:hypothetical protein C2G38_1248241 [Gigaspora rosea]
MFTSVIPPVMFKSLLPALMLLPTRIHITDSVQHGYIINIIFSIWFMKQNLSLLIVILNFIYVKNIRMINKLVNFNSIHKFISRVVNFNLNNIFIFAEL